MELKHAGDAQGLQAEWAKIYDKAHYLQSEHDLKEKEYGIPWRSAYKAAIIAAVAELEHKKLVTEKSTNTEQSFEIINRVAGFVKQEVDRLAGVKGQIEQINKLVTQYEVFQRNIIYLKKLLKEPNPAKFEDVKKSVF
jgi:hypothetical protein